MKRKLTAASLLLAGVLGFVAAPYAFGESKKEEKSELQAKAKISETEARKIALAKVPNGTAEEGELEEEDGHLIWSFDIATAGTKDVTEVQVDAVSGAIVSSKTESAADEAKEKKQDEKKEKKGEKKEKKEKKDKEDKDDDDDKKG